ncbi:serine hydrolase domain-containing protein [Streptomyces sp. NPDC004244]|uniref:serine hydrolase domain-containing protein n=1 Tax=Streptomyces sp. NPDC101206 TaxID=3366128 RepID=UPI003809507F
MDERTLFPVASTTKSFTATALVRLAAEGRVDLDAPVRRYVPELRLADEEAAAAVTVLHLLDHTSGLDWNLIDTDEEDQSLAGFVAELSRLTLLAAPGALGYNRGEDGELRVATPWKAFRGGSRGNDPGGAAVSSASDLLRWARWFLCEVDGVRAIRIGGSGNGQFSELLIVPERDFAVVSLANCGPAGHPFDQGVVRWALEHHLGLVEREPHPDPYDDARAREVAGRYENDVLFVDIATDGTRLTLAARIKPEIRAASDTEMPPDHAPAGMGLLPGDRDEYVITGGGLQGERGFFSRDENGAVVGVDLAGRLFTRAPAPM